MRLKSRLARKWLTSAVIFLLVILNAFSNSLPRNYAVVEEVEVSKINLTGELSAQRYQLLHWQTTGVVQRVLPNGSPVTKNDVVAELDLSTVDQEMKQALEKFAEIETLVLERDENHDIYLESANAAVRYYRKMVESAEISYKTLGSPKLTAEEFSNLKKNLASAEVTMNERHTRYLNYVIEQEGPKKTQDAKLEWQEAKADYDSLNDILSKQTSAPTDTDIVIARQKLEDARTALDYAIMIRDNIKAGDYRVLFQHNAGYDSYDVYSNYVFYSSDEWNPIHNTLDDQLKAQKLIIDRVKQTAPFDGEVFYVSSMVGDSVEVGAISVGILDRNSLRVLVEVPENIIHNLVVGDIVTMKASFGNSDELTGKIKLIQPVSRTDVVALSAIEGSDGLDVSMIENKLFDVIIDIDQKDIPALLGSQIMVEFTLSEPLKALAVVPTAIQRDENGDFFLVVNHIGDVYKVQMNRGEKIGNLQVVYPVGNCVLEAGDHVVDFASMVVD